MSVLINLLLVVVGVSRSAINIDPFIGILQDFRHSTLLHVNVRAQCFLVKDRLGIVVVAFQHCFVSFQSRLSLLFWWLRRFLFWFRIHIDSDAGIRDECC